MKKLEDGKMMRWFWVLLICISFPAMSSDSPLKSGDVFKDCESCPELVVIPAGKFLMGDTQYTYPVILGGKNGKIYWKEMATTQPIHEVNISKPFAMGRFEITIAEWQACVNENVCPERDTDPIELLTDWKMGIGNMRYPQQYVSFEDSEVFLGWISQKTGHTYRLPSEAEWEYAARAGTQTPFWWGTEGDPNKAVFSYGLHRFTFWGLLDQRYANFSEVGSKAPNPFGLYDMLGNLSESVQDCVNNSYEGAPNDGSPWLSGNCKRRNVRGGSYLIDNLESLVVSSRDDVAVNSHGNLQGFRVVRELD